MSINTVVHQRRRRSALALYWRRAQPVVRGVLAMPITAGILTLIAELALSLVTSRHCPLLQQQLMHTDVHPNTVCTVLVCACPVYHCVICVYAIRSLDHNFPVNTYLLTGRTWFLLLTVELISRWPLLTVFRLSDGNIIVLLTFDAATKCCSKLYLLLVVMWHCSGWHSLSVAEHVFKDLLVK